MALFPYQERVDKLLRAGRNVILQAPTGAGKTRAALFPFIDGWRNDATAFPRQCIYAVPMRVLANQFEVEYKKWVDDFTGSYGFTKTVAVQTGAKPDNSEFDADLLFTTIDQVLSSALTIPYSLSNRQANLNAGAIVGSYLVFDEFHLFPVDEDGGGALATTLHLLTMLKRVTPFVLMTATFSETMLDELCTLLDADPVTLTPEEIQAIPSQQGKQRCYRYVAQPLDAEAIISDFVAHQRQRVIAVCNTVDRAQQLARDLRADARLDGVEIELLHSRFYASDREAKEKIIRQEFGENDKAYTPKPIILVATQVIEVGLNITCEVLHTEMAPASAIVQRAGRCARFTGEHGTVLVYDVPPKDDGTPNYAPYFDGRPRGEDGVVIEGHAKVCERTQAALAVLPPAGQIFTYHAELTLVNAAHESHDQRLLEQLRNNSSSLSHEVEQVFRERDRTAARDLIRDIDNRSVLIFDNPNETTLSNPYQYESIGLRRNTLLRWYRDIQPQAMELGVDWIVKIPTFIEADSGKEGAEQRHKIEVVWTLVHRPSSDPQDIRAACKDIASSGLIAVHPALVQYDTKMGLQILPGITPAKNAPLAPFKGKRKDYGPLHRETYDEHIAGLQRVYTETLRERTAAVRRHFEQRLSLASGTLDRAIRTMFAAHDIGKLDRRWQRWAHEWQKKVSVLRDNPALIAPDTEMLAHTDYDSSDAKERQANANHAKKLPRPQHAAESALAGRKLLEGIAGDCEPLYYALVTAIICHHSADLLRDRHDEFHPANGAPIAFDEAFKRVGLFNDAVLRASNAKVAWEGFTAGAQLSGDTVDVRSTDAMLLYLLLVRVLRLSDQKSQERDL